MGKKDKTKKLSQFDEIEEPVYKKKVKPVKKTEFEIIEEAIIETQNTEKRKNNDRWNKKQKNKKRDRWDDFDDDGWN